MATNVVVVVVKGKYLAKRYIVIYIVNSIGKNQKSFKLEFLKVFMTLIFLYMKPIQTPQLIFLLTNEFELGFQLKTNNNKMIATTTMTTNDDCCHDNENVKVMMRL